jgi:serine/threonine protein kinase
MAQVYKGIDLSLKRPVAIKVINEGYRASAVYAQRFEREAQAVASLKHPNIVTIFRFGKLDNLYYLVMEYIDGVDLNLIMHNYAAQGELMPHHDVIRIVEAIGSALDYAHSQGVIHRDIKPSNIMIERDGRPVLTDFGLALRLSEGTIGDTFGSPHYISPEQARNSANAVPQSDQYSLGVITYELLTGVVPFEDPSPTALAMQHIMAEVPSPRAFNRALSEQVEQVLFKILAKKPEDRFSSGVEFSRALNEALKVNPGKVATTDLPPLPAGVVPPPPRRVSMQTAFDKVNQELNLTHAKGQALTQYPPLSQEMISRPSSRPRQRKWLPYLIALLAAGIALLAVGFLFSRQFAASPLPTMLVNLPSAEATTPIPAVVASSSPLPPTATSKAPATNVPTATVVPATVTPTTLPSSPTSLVTVPPTLPPAAVPSVQPNTAIPTVAYPNGRLFVLLWTDTAIYIANQSGQRVPTNNMSFERVLTNGQVSDRYLGGRWAAYYPYIEASKCVILKVQGTFSNLPRNECPYGYNSEINAQHGEIFWTAADNSVEFRVLWNKQEIARCQIAQNRCEVRLPPT